MDWNHWLKGVVSDPVRELEAFLSTKVNCFLIYAAVSYDFKERIYILSLQNLFSRDASTVLYIKVAQDIKSYDELKTQCGALTLQSTP